VKLPVQLVLIRHGQSQENEANRLAIESSGNKTNHEVDPAAWPLTEKGHEQAIITGEWIRQNISNRFSSYYVSPYLRARQTTDELGLEKADWQIDPMLREREWGQIENLLPYQRRQHPGRKEDSFNWQPDGGESMQHLCERVRAFLESASGEKVIVVCHGELMWAFRVVLEQMALPRWYELDWSEDNDHHIFNCQVLNYTRLVEPDAPGSDIEPTYIWMRSVCPWDQNLSTNSWQKINRRDHSKTA